jgi:hypothetical protein
LSSLQLKRDIPDGSRAIRAVRDKTGFDSELKFSGITRGSLTVY